MPSIQTLIRVVELKTKPKNTIELATNLTNYYFAEMYDSGKMVVEDWELFEKKREMFCIYILDFMLGHKEFLKKRFRFKKVLGKIDRDLNKWKRKRFKAWLSTAKGVSHKDILLKKQSLGLSCFSFILCLF